MAFSTASNVRVSAIGFKKVQAQTECKPLVCSACHRRARSAKSVQGGMSTRIPVQFAIAWSSSSHVSLRTKVLRSPNSRQRRLDATASSAAASPEPEITEDKASVAAFLNAFWKFLRPHTIRGTLLGTSAVVTRVLMENSFFIDWALLPRALLGLVALLCGNGYIVGINQIYDVEIDQVNKPFLPMASGELTVTQAWSLCAALALGGMAIVLTQFDTLISSLYAFGLFLGTIYSVPPLRLKRSAVAAFMIIATVRGFLLNFGVYHATRAALGLQFQWSPPITFITCFVTLFATVIAITKDLPDIQGDREGNIDTFATRFGERAITFLGSGLLLVNYAGAIIAGLTISAFNMPLMVGAHALLGLSVVFETFKLDKQKYTVDAIRDFYRHIWNIFYCEYLLLPFL